MNILKVDVDKINEEIAIFSAVNNKTPYLICSEETMKLLVSQCIVIANKEEIEKIKNRGMISYYCGTKVLPDNNLKLGDIEIR